MSECPYKRRSDIPAPPRRMESLPIERRGYPVPFFVATVKGEPDFRVAEPKSMIAAIRQKRCWTCGEPLGNEAVFVIGPMCTINRVSSEPPSHAQCARYAATACPFLTKPHMSRRTEGMPEQRIQPAGIMLAHNPGVTALWFARGWKMQMHPGGPLWHFTTSPAAVEWYAEGRTATRAEVDAAIERGLPKLQVASQLDGSEAHLAAWIERAQRLLPR